MQLYQPLGDLWPGKAPLAGLMSWQGDGALFKLRSKKLDLDRNFTCKGQALVMSLPLGAFRVGSWPTSLMHKVKLDTEATGWALPVMEEVRQWWQELFCNTSWSQSQLLPGACFWAHLVNVENRWWTATALKNRCKTKGQLWYSKALTFQILPCADWATWKTYGNFPPFKKT